MSTLPFADKTITVFNAYKVLDSTGKPNIAWQASVLPHCFFEQTHRTSTASDEHFDGDGFVAKAPFSTKYVCASDWCKLERKDGFFTVQNGDVIALGSLPISVPLGKTPTSVLCDFTKEFFTAHTAKANILLPTTAHFYWSDT